MPRGWANYQQVLPSPLPTNRRQRLRLWPIMMPVNDGRPLSFCRKSKWNLTEKKITSCSFQWVDIILFSLVFFLQPRLQAQHPLCKPYPRAQPYAVYVCMCGCVYVCVYASSSSSGLRLVAPFAFCQFFFIYFMPTHIRAKQFDRCRRLSGCLPACLPRWLAGWHGL